MQFSTNIDGSGFENSYNSYEQYPLENFFIFTIYQNYTLSAKLDYPGLRDSIVKGVLIIRILSYILQ